MLNYSNNNNIFEKLETRVTVNLFIWSMRKAPVALILLLLRPKMSNSLHLSNMRSASIADLIAFGIYFVIPFIWAMKEVLTSLI
jgi:hypothetical protein